MKKSFIMETYLVGEGCSLIKCYNKTLLFYQSVLSEGSFIIERKLAPREALHGGHKHSSYCGVKIKKSETQPSIICGLHISKKVL